MNIEYIEKHKNILVFAPHPDDEILGVGGTILQNIKEGNEVYVCLVTKGCEPIFPTDSVQKVQTEARTCYKKAGVKEAFFLDLPAAMLDTIPSFEINEKIIDVVEKVQPDEVYIPHSGDMHKDHQIVVDAVMVACRPKYSFAPKRIYAYETLSETDWNLPNVGNAFIPNVFKDISDVLNEKIQLIKLYQSQLSDFPNARSVEAVEALAKYRGALMNMQAAEAFLLIREIS